MKCTVTTAKLLLTIYLIVIFNQATSCESPFIEYEGSCYYVGKLYYNWRKSLKDCQDRGSTLASVHSMTEANFVERLVGNRGFFSDFIGFWIGFSAIESDGIFQWTDKTAVDFTNFDEKEPNNFENQEDCVTTSKINGKWNDDNCDKQFSYVCKYVKNTTVPAIVPTAQDSTTGNCMKGWIPHLDRCYYISGKEEKHHLSWEEARDFCDKKGGYLTSIRDSTDQNFLAYLLQIIGTDAWIGFKSSPSYQYVWLDNSDNLYTNWGSYTYGHTKNCAKMLYNHVNSGVWIEGNCDRKLGFICYTKKDSKFPTVPSDGDMKCVHPEGWLKLNNMCFQLFEGNLLTWEEAEHACNKKGAHLVSVSDHTVRAAVSYLTKETNQSFFIGLKYDKENQTFKWINNFPLTLSMWDKNEPVYATEDSCYASTSEGYWKKVNCDSQLPYLCQKTKSKPKFNKYVGNCPSSSSSWLQGRHSYCFLRWNETLSYFAAWSKCREYDSHLISIHSMEEIEDLRKFLQDLDTPSIYLGLERNSKGGFRWADDSAVNFENWEANGSFISDNHKTDCVEMYTHNMKWKVTSCSSLRLFLCMAKKSTLVVEDIETVSEYDIDISANPLVPAAILGTLLAIGLIGFFYYIMKIRKRSATDVDASDPKNFEMTEKMSMCRIASKIYD